MEDTIRIAFVLITIVFVFIMIYFILNYISNDKDSASDDVVSRIKPKDIKKKGDDSASAKRRQELRDAIKKIEAEHKKKSGSNPTLSSLISYSGIQISKKTVYIISGILGLIVWILSLIISDSLFISVCIALSAALILPRMFLKIIVNKRKNKFLDELPNALDIIVRSVRSGLPVSDAFVIIVSQSPEPIKSEFSRVVESQHLGLSVSESVSRMIRYMPLREVSFFATVIVIQSQSGGNLSEALSNLSRVLRDRKKMKAKIQALSMEAKSSAWIIGSLPFIVSALVYFASPGYMSILFVDPRGHVILGCAGFMMTIGVLVMRAMINFDV